MGENSHSLKQQYKTNITRAFSKGEKLKIGAQIVQFSERKRWVIVLPGF